MHLSGSPEYSDYQQGQKVSAPKCLEPVPRTGASSLAAAAALEQAPAGRAEPEPVGDQAGLDPLLVRNGVVAQPECIGLARLSFLLSIGLDRGWGSERDPSQHDPKRDQFLHRSAPVMAACCSHQLWKETPHSSVIRVARWLRIHRSSHFGGRFSTKAAIPSSASRASMFSTMTLEA